MLGILLLAGCGKPSEQEAKAPPASQPGLTADQANGATITGKVNFTGTKPVARVIDVSANPACAKMHSGPVQSEEVVVNSNNTLANTFVWLKEGVPAGQWTAPSNAVLLDQQGCLFKPHVI